MEGDGDEEPLQLTHSGDVWEDDQGGGSSVGAAAGGTSSHHGATGGPHGATTAHVWGHAAHHVGGHGAGGSSTGWHVELRAGTGCRLHHLLGGATHTTHGSLQASTTRAGHATAGGPANAGAGGGTGQVDAGSLLSGWGSLEGHGDDGLPTQQQQAHGALLLLLLFVLLAADAPELLAVGQDHVHVLVERFEYPNECPAVLHGHLHPVADVTQHLVILGERHFEEV